MSFPSLLIQVTTSLSSVPPLRAHQGGPTSVLAHQPLGQARPWGGGGWSIQSWKARVSDIRPFQRPCQEEVSESSPFLLPMKGTACIPSLLQKPSVLVVEKSENTNKQKEENTILLHTLFCKLLFALNNRAGAIGPGAGQRQHFCNGFSCTACHHVCKEHRSSPCCIRIPGKPQKMWISSSTPKRF